MANTIGDIREVHNNILEYLISWNEVVGKDKSINPYFYTRSTRDKRFMAGYWFPGNEDYVCITFWRGGDAFNKTPNISLDIHKKYGCRIIITSKDSEAKYSFLEGLVQDIDSQNGEKYIKRNKHWIKPFSGDISDYMAFVKNFVANEKVVIDEYIEDHINDIDVEDYIQPIGFIKPSDFDEMLSRVLRQKIALEQDRKPDETLIDNALLKLPKSQFGLKGIDIKNYQGIIEASIDNISFNTQWLFVTGENGYGKTSFIQAIALCLSNNSDLEKFIEENTEIKTTIIFENDEDFVFKRQGSYNSGASIRYTPNIIGYGPSRLNTRAAKSQNQDIKSQDNVVSLFDTEALLRNLKHELFATNDYDKEAFKALTNIIKAVTNEKIIALSVGKEDVFLREKIKGEELPWIPLIKLAAGFRNIINIVGDIFIRLSKALGHSRYKDFFGIVLIDEIENHLHPHIQKGLVIALSKVFPKIQFIVTTHSPIPLLGAPANSKILHVERSLKKGIEIRSLDYVDFKNLLPNALLTSQAFGFQEIKPISNINVDELNVDDSMQDTQFFELVERKLKEIETMQHLKNRKSPDKK